MTFLLATNHIQNSMDLHKLLYNLLLKNPEGRKTENIQKVFVYVMRSYGAITPDGRWDNAAYKQMPGLQTIDRLLRKVKQENGWQDEKAKEQEEKWREEYRT